MSELKKNQAPSLYNDHYSAASVKVLQRNKNDFIDRKTVWRIAILSFLLGAILVMLALWLVKKMQFLSEPTWSIVDTTNVPTQPKITHKTADANLEPLPLPSESMAHAQTGLTSSDLVNGAVINSTVTAKKLTQTAAPKPDVIEEWINTHLTAKDGKAKNTKKTQTEQHIISVAPALTNNTLPTEQVESNPFKILETEEVVRSSASKTKNPLKNSISSPHRNNPKPASKSDGRVKSATYQEIAQKQARQQSQKKDK